MKLKALSIAVAAATLATISTGASAEWTVGGYGKFKYDFGESYDRQSTWEHRRDMRAAGPFFSANVNQVEFSLKNESTYKNGVWANYVLRTEYGNNEGGNGQPFYGSSSGNEGHLETGQLEFKEAYVELGAMPSVLPKDGSIWAGRRFLNRQQGLVSKEFWKQSSGVGAGLNFTKSIGLAIVSADPGEGSCNDGGNNQNQKNCSAVNADGTRSTLNSVDFYAYQIEALGGTFDFDLKYSFRANTDELGNVGNSKAAEDGYGASIMYATTYYGLEGWSVTALTYGKGMNTNRGVNFGQWNGNWSEDDSSIFFTSNGVVNATDSIQIGTEVTYWGIDMKESKNWGTESVDRLFVGVTPSFKVNENFRVELIGTYARETLGEDGAWGRDGKSTDFFTATLAPVWTVNADYFGRPQVKPYVTYMTSSWDGYTWTKGNDKSNQTVFGVEAEIWF
ncbi:carbohydrate porin [Agarivorans aestuarii]|uniref:Carbohydrate porin n=1 Tax=Agarivorans aestuarii TaxID=1563703 RepID=A0ABU7G8A7_9ALTE|nr:carbohydrate porin [Agarivorans aestuarii]MEE1675628.1 carbohydrate porin [Agarivorans aestuarii]